MAKRGAPPRNTNAEKHGLVALENTIRQGHSYMDRRVAEGEDALRLQAGLVDDQGGIDALTTAQFIAIEGLTREVFFRDLMDAQITKLLRKYEAAKNPRMLAKIYSYRSPYQPQHPAVPDALGAGQETAAAKDLGRDPSRGCRPRRQRQRKRWRR